MKQALARKGWPYLLLALATLAVWGHTLGFGFVYDDAFFIRDLASVRSLKNIPDMFWSLEAQAHRAQLSMVFRPLRTAHYALLYFLGGQSEPQPWIFHLANVLWHGATAMLLFALSARVLARLRPGLAPPDARLWALFVALAFALHPVVSEVVCWAKALDDILAAFFVLAALRELLVAPEGRGARWRALGFFALAMYSKESAVPFALLALLVLRGIHGLPWRRALRRTAEFGLVAAFYLVHRRLVLGRSSQVAPLSGSYAQTLVDMAQVVPKYVRLLFGVPPFRMDYGDLEHGRSLAEPGMWGGLLLLALLIVAGFLAWRRPGLRACGFGLAWTGVFLLPVSNLLPMMQYMAERFLYLPLLGWCLALATVLAALPYRALARALALVALVGAAWSARQRSEIWRDEYTLFVTSYQQGLRSSRVEHNVTAALLTLPGIQRVWAIDPETGKLEFRRATDEAAQAEALRDFERALEVTPDNAALLSGYAMTLGNAGQHERAVQLFERAVRLKPKNAQFWQNLLGALLFTGELERARAAAARAVELLPADPGVLALQAEIERKLRERSSD